MTKYITKIITIIVLLAFLALGVYVYQSEIKKPLFEAYFFSLNRGRAVLIRTPHGRNILIDGGQTGDIVAELTKIFPFYRRHVDTVIITSPAPKNAGGLVEVMKRYDIDKVIRPDFVGTSTALTAFDVVVADKKIKVENQNEFEIDMVKFKALFKEPLVLEISYASTTITLLGDLLKKDQKTLIVSVQPSTIVEYSHSASDSRVSADLFNKLSPEKIIINKKETGKIAPSSNSKTKKKFDLSLIDRSRVTNLEKGTAHLIF